MTKEVFWVPIETNRQYSGRLDVFIAPTALLAKLLEVMRFAVKKLLSAVGSLVLWPIDNELHVAHFAGNTRSVTKHYIIASFHLLHFRGQRGRGHTVGAVASCDHLRCVGFKGHIWHSRQYSTTTHTTWEKLVSEISLTIVHTILDTDFVGRKEDVTFTALNRVELR